MPDLLNFTWHKCPDGYQALEFDPELFVENHKDDTRAFWVLKSDKDNQTKTLVERHGLMEFSGNEELNKKAHYISANSDDLIKCKPLDESTGLFMELYELFKLFEYKKYIPPNPALAHMRYVFKDGKSEQLFLKSIVEFATKYGLLQIPYLGTDKQYWRWIPEYIQTWKTLCISIGLSVDTWQRCENISDWSMAEKPLIGLQGSANLRLLTNGDNSGLQLLLEPNSLYDAIRMQMALSISNNTQLKRCVSCTTWFSYGSGTNRRKSSHYCSDKCRKTTWRANQEKKK